MYELKANLKGRFESFRQRIVEYELLPDSDMDPWTLATAPVVNDNSGRQQPVRRTFKTTSQHVLTVKPPATERGADRYGLFRIQTDN